MATPEVILKKKWSLPLHTNIITLLITYRTLPRDVSYRFKYILALYLYTLQWYLQWLIRRLQAVLLSDWWTVQHCLPKKSTDCHASLYEMSKSLTVWWSMVPSCWGDQLQIALHANVTSTNEMGLHWSGINIWERFQWCMHC